MKSAIHPDEVLATLLSSTHRPERRAALKAIHAICEDLHKGMARDFRVGTVGMIAEARGIIKKKTLSNKSSEALKKLIEAWAGYSGGDHGESRDVGRSVIEERLLAIQDPALRALIQNRLAERERLLAQINMLRAGTQLVVNIAASNGRANPDNKSDSPVLHESEKAALRQVLDAKFLTGEGWIEGEHGEVCDADTGRRIFPKGFLSALRKVLGVLEPTRTQR